MTKVIILSTFHGANFANVYAEGTIHFLEDAGAQALALRGLVKILTEDEKKESPKVEVETPNTEVETSEDVVEAQEVQETVVEDAPKAEEAQEEKPKRGRKPSTK